MAPVWIDMDGSNVRTEGAMKTCNWPQMATDIIQERERKVWKKKNQIWLNNKK